MSVAFALLRKPLRDQLFMMEWILADRDGFLAEFAKGPESVDICDLLKKKEKWMRSIVDSAINKSVYANFTDTDFLWGLRFDKAVDWSLENDWNQALHLITTNKHYRTETEHLNFAFITEEAREEMQERFYLLSSTVFMHFCGVVRAIVERWKPDFFSMGRVFDIRLIANLELATRALVESPIDHFGVDGVNEYFEALDFSCTECQLPIRITGPIGLEPLVIDSHVTCSHCGTRDRRLAMVASFDEGELEDDSTADSDESA